MYKPFSRPKRGAAVGTDVLRACAGCVAAIDRTRRAAIEIRGDAAALSNGSRPQRLGPEDEEKSVNQDPRLVAYRSFPPCNPAALALLYFVGALTEPPASARPDTNNPADKMTSAVEIVMKLLCIGSSWLKGLIWVSLRCNIAANLNPSCLQQPYVNARR